ncbi:MAG: PEP-CTERM sorting domain-containing protein [Crocosphaera sp.]|nr:PEP-CTERM sorting domain-containing protein [Crocosphaera sp.]
MFNVKPAALGAAFIGTAATMTLTAASAQAASISGSVVGFGLSEARDNIIVDFSFGSTFATGDLADLNGATTLATLEFTQVEGDQYSYESLSPFMTFLNGSTFNLDAGTATVTFNGPEVEIDLSPIVGDLFGPPPEKAFRVELSGTLSLSDNAINDPGSLGSYQYNLQPVPEPLTILGAGTAIAFGGAFKRKLGKNNKKGSTKA